MDDPDAATVELTLDRTDAPQISRQLKGNYARPAGTKALQTVAIVFREFLWDKYGTGKGTGVFKASQSGVGRTATDRSAQLQMLLSAVFNG